MATDLPEPLPVWGHPAGLRQVLTNLIFNALDAMPDGGTVMIRGWTTDTEVYLSVRDTGLGMIREVQERIFQPFFTTKKDQGTGLGLSICKRVIEEHGGKIEVSSKPGVGSVFTVVVPKASRLPEDRQTESGQPSSAPLRVLLVDDEPQVREVLIRMLRLDGHQSTAAASAKEGLALLSEGEYDLLLTDLGLPDMPGWQLAKSAKEGERPIPVVLITGWTEDSDQPLSGGEVDAILVKPFGIAELRQVMHSAMGGSAPAP